MIASADGVDDQCVTWMGSIANGPSCQRSPRLDTLDAGRSTSSCSLELRAVTSAGRQRRRVDRHVEVAQHVRQRADVVLVAVRDDEAAEARAELRAGSSRSGITRSMPSMLTARETSRRSRWRSRSPPYSSTRQLRPISPRPPSGTMRSTSALIAPRHPSPPNVPQSPRQRQDRGRAAIATRRR